MTVRLAGVVFVVALLALAGVDAAYFTQYKPLESWTKPIMLPWEPMR